MPAIKYGVKTCIHCGSPFGNHKADCQVKFRDETNPDPEVQRQHESLDEYYREQERWKLKRDQSDGSLYWTRQD